MKNINIDSVQEMVTKAALMLDKVIPGWFKSSSKNCGLKESWEATRKYLAKMGPYPVAGINLKRLDMNKSFQCILGQLYGCFWDAPSKFNTLRAFMPYTGMPNGLFTTMWTNEILRRRHKKLIPTDGRWAD